MDRASDLVTRPGRHRPPPTARRWVAVVAAGAVMIAIAVIFGGYLAWSGALIDVE